MSRAVCSFIFVLPAVISFRFIVYCASFLKCVGPFFMTAWRILKLIMEEAISNDGGDMLTGIKVRLRG